MKKILGIICLIFMVSVFMSCNKTSAENVNTAPEKSEVLLKTEQEDKKVQVSKNDESQELRGKSQAILKMEEEEKIQKAISMKKNLIKQKRDEAERHRKDEIRKEARAQFKLGNKYANGKGSTRNFGEAIKCFKKSSELGYAAAQHSLGLMYFKGEGVEVDYVKAYKWVALSAIKNKNYAQLRVLIETKLTEEELVIGKALVSGFIPKNKVN